MIVHTSTIGYYGVHYRNTTTIEVAEADLRPCDLSTKLMQTREFTPMLLSERVVQQYNLPSAVVWKAK